MRSKRVIKTLFAVLIGLSSVGVSNANQKDAAIRFELTDSIKSPSRTVTVEAGRVDQKSYLYVGGEGNTMGAYSVSKQGKLQLVDTHKVSKKYSGIRGLTHVDMDDKSFLVVGNKLEGKIEIHRIQADGTLLKISETVDTDSIHLAQNITIEHIQIRDNHYLFVGGVDAGLSCFKLSTQGQLEHIHSLADSDSTSLNGVIGMSSVVIQGKNYLFCGGFMDGGVSSFRVYDNGHFECVDTIHDDKKLFLNGAYPVNSVRLGDRYYLLVGHRHNVHYKPENATFQKAYHGNGINLFSIDASGKLRSHAVLADTDTTLLKGSTRIAILKQSEKKALVFIATRDDKGIQVCSLTEDGVLSPIQEFKTGYSIYNGMALQQVDNKWFLFTGTYDKKQIYCYLLKLGL